MMYFTSDLHLNHNKEFIWKERGFSSVEEMNNVIISNLSSIVKEDDDLYLLGDIVLGEFTEQSKELLYAIPGRKHIILGNHDSKVKQEFYKTWAEDVKYADMIKISKRMSAYLSHYPTIVDNGGERAIVNFSGHTHSKEKFYMGNPSVYNVAVDAHNCMPVSIEEIMNDIRTEIVNKRNKEIKK